MKVTKKQPDIKSGSDAEKNIENERWKFCLQKLFGKLRLPQRSVEKNTKEIVKISAVKSFKNSEN